MKTVAGPPKQTKPTPNQKLLIAHEGHFGLRTVDRYFWGKDQRTNTRERIEATLKRLNLEHLTQPSATEADK